MCRDHGESRLPRPFQLTCNQSVRDVSWSGTKEGKLASCSSASSDVHIWNATANTCELTLNGSRRNVSGRIGLLALQTIKVCARPSIYLSCAESASTSAAIGHARDCRHLHPQNCILPFLQLHSPVRSHAAQVGTGIKSPSLQDSPFMLAAGGYSAVMHLWDARASTSPSISLPVPSKEPITSVLCCTATHRAMAGTMSGHACLWDLRKLQSHRPQVFGAQGAHVATCLAAPYLPAVLAKHQTTLPRSVLLQLCLARVRTFGCFEAMVQAAETAVAEQQVPMQAAGKVGLCRAHALAHGQSSHVTQLLADPGDSSRVAFSLACGAGGVCSSPWLPCHDPSARLNQPCSDKA
jgi:hypothetical protein